MWVFVYLQRDSLIENLNRIVVKMKLCLFVYSCACMRILLGVVYFVCLFVCLRMVWNKIRTSIFPEAEQSINLQINNHEMHTAFTFDTRTLRRVYIYIYQHSSSVIHTYIHTYAIQSGWECKREKKVCKMKCKRRKKCTSKDIRSGKKTRLKMKLFNPVHTYERDNHANVNFRLEQIYFKSFLHTHTTLYARTCFVQFQQAILPRCHDPVTCALLLANQ